MAQLRGYSPAAIHGWFAGDLPEFAAGPRVEHANSLTAKGEDICNLQFVASKAQSR